MQPFRRSGKRSSTSLKSRESSWSSLEAIQEFLAADLRRVEERLLDRTASRYEFVDLAVEHVVEAGGKRLRPMLLILAARALGAQGSAVYDLAAAMELIHVASLAHDDVIDEAKLRRNRETLNAKFGNKVAVLVGDYMHARVLAILVEAGATEPIYRAVAYATQGMCEGEVIAAYKGDDFELEVDEYLRIIELKTARLIESCCRIGALLATDRPELLDALSTYGRAVGTAFQIVDDILDLTGDPQRFGKPTRNDIREGKMTLPLLYARDHASPEVRERMAALFAQIERSPEEIDWIAEQTEQLGGVAYAHSVARDLSSKAKDALLLLPATEAREALRGLVDALIAREY